MSVPALGTSRVPVDRAHVVAWCLLVVVGVGCGHVAPALVLLVWAVPVAWAAAVDARVGRLPDGIVLPGLAAVAAVLAVSAMWGGRPRPGGALAGAALLGVPFLLLHLATPNGFGFGDVKYGILLGLGVGLVHPGLVVVVFASAAVVQLVVAWGRVLPAQRVAGADRRSAPFGPALAFAAVGWLLVSLTVGGGR